MKETKTFPRVIISLLLCIALLLNTAAPVLAQVPKTRRNLTPSSLEHIDRQTYTAVADGFSTSYTNPHNRILESSIRFSNGKLTQAQLSRLHQIQLMFSPTTEQFKPKSDFERFQPLYTDYIDKEFTREQQAMKAAIAETSVKIKDTANNYRKEVYEPLVRQVTSRVLETQANGSSSEIQNLSQNILNRILLSTYKPDQDLNTQLSNLSTHYQNDPQALAVLNGIVDETQKDDKYLLREQAVLQWSQQADKQLQSWHKQNFTSLTKWKKQANAKAQQVFDKEYEPQLLKAREEEVRKAVRDLWAYKGLAPKSHQQLLDLAPVILQLRTMDGKPFFSQEQKEWLYKEYMQLLAKNRNCGENNPQENSCHLAFLAIGGLSMLTDKVQAARAIEDFMSAKQKTPFAVPALLTGAAALLSMKQYDVLGGFLYTATRDEYNIGNLDLLSFETLVNLFATMNGQYLGEVSKYAQYPLQDKPTDQTPMANAWEDLAHLLAQDGSPRALALLREYGVEKCYVVTETTLTLKDKQKIVCMGIMPFLAGALASGKSGADKYNPKGFNTTPGYYLNANGQSGYISPEKARQNAQQQALNNKAFFQYAKSMGLSTTAMLARHLFIQSMGDLNAESELRLDTNLYKTYKATNPHPKPGFSITSYARNSDPYNAKRVRQDRTQFWRKAARIGDIAVLVWCLYDIGKWIRNGVKIARAVTKASSMARNGATVAERAVMLRRLNITPQLRNFTNIGTKIRNGMAPAVLAEMPHFTSSSVQLPKFEGFVESAGKLVAQNMRFSAETGVLSADMPALTDAAQGAYSADQLNAFNGLLNAATERTNMQFANRSGFKKLFTFDKNASYRSYLMRNLRNLEPTPGMTTADLHTLAMQTPNLGIRVPQNIASFKAPSFLETAKGARQLNMRAVTSALNFGLGTPASAEEISHTETLLNTALLNANAQFLNRSWLSRQWNFLWHNSDKKYKSILLDNVAAEFDKDGKIFSDPNYFKFHQYITHWITKDATLSAPAWATQFRHFGTGLSHGGKFQAMGTTLLTQGNAAPLKLPLAVQMQVKRPFRGGIKGVDDSAYQRVLISDKGGNLFFGFGNDVTNPVNPNQFKLILESEDMPALLRAAQGYTGSPLEVKLTAPSGNFFGKRYNAWQQARLDGHWNPIPALFRGKNSIYVYEVPAFVRQADGTLSKLPLTFRADSFLNLRGATAVLENGGKLAWYRDGNLLNVPALTYHLPKNQIRPFLGILETAQLENPLRVTAVSGKNKILPLMWATGLSLSSASSGLIVPLEGIYGDRITEMDKTWISLAFPYLPSLAAPLFSPLMMKIGALRTLQLALGVSTAGLTFAALNGFNGKVNKDNPPPIWPLFVSGIAIGISSALSRSGLNLLIDTMGGGASLLKSMAFKNLGSFALLLPPFAFNFLDPQIDFSLAFPTLGLISAAALTWVSSSRLSTEIGKTYEVIKKDGTTEKFMPLLKLDWSNPLSLPKTIFQNTRSIGTSTWQQTWSTMRLLGTKEVLPLVLAATAFTGFEAGAFSKAGNQLVGQNLKGVALPEFVPETNRKNYTSMTTNLSVIAFPLAMRFASKPLLKMMETKIPGDEYRRMLQTSFTLNAVGAGLLYANGFDGYLSPGMLGIALMGLGTANMTQSFQKLSNISVKSSRYAQSLMRGLPATAKAAMERDLTTKTMTGFPMQQLGIAIVPTLVSTYTDHQIDEGIIQKKEAPLSSMWIPIASLALCFGLSMPHINLAPARLPTGLFGLTKGVVGSYPGAVQQLMQPQFYLKEPVYGMPNGFVPMLNNPILNLNDVLPGQQVLKRIEHSLKQDRTAPAKEPTSGLQEDPVSPVPDTSAELPAHTF